MQLAGPAGILNFVAAASARMAVYEPVATQRMHMLEQYQEAVQWLKTVACECQKTENIDLVGMLTGCENCFQCIQRLMAIETDPIRISGLEQLISALVHHKRIITAKKQQLEFPMPISNSSIMADKTTGVHYSAGGEDDQAQRRHRAIEATILESRGMSFKEVAGLAHAKQALKEAIVLPVRYPHLFSGARQPWKRILLYGPPGTGKTRLAQAVSGEIDSTFYSVSSADLISSWVGESEKLIRDLFQNARQKAGRSVIFIDEIDSICRHRCSKEEEHTRRIKTELLRQMEGVDHTTDTRELFLLCATNCPWDLDTAFLRRFQRRIFVALPDSDARKQILHFHIDQTGVALSVEEMDKLVACTEGYSGSDMTNCIADALLEPVRELEYATHWRPVEQDQYCPCESTHTEALCWTLSDIPPQQVCLREASMEDFIKALERNSRTIAQQDLDKYIEFTQKYGQAG